MVPRMTHQNPAEHACDAPGADDPLIRILADSPLCPSPSEAHGMLCGLVCGGASNPEDAWLAQLLPEAESGDLLQAEARAALSGITRQTLDELAGSELRLGLLLPDDSQLQQLEQQLDEDENIELMWLKVEDFKKIEQIINERIANKKKPEKLTIYKYKIK